MSGLLLCKEKGEEVQNGKNRARYKLKCHRCKYINFYDKDDIVTDDKVPYIVCDGCSKKIELKKIR